MKTRIEHKDKFTIAGLRRNGIAPSACPDVWDELYAAHDHKTLKALGNGQSYGTCADMQDEDHFDYMAGYDVTDSEKARALGLDILEVPAHEYAVAKLKGPVPQCIHAGWAYMMGEYFPEQGFTHAGTPDLEVYGEGDIHSPDYEMELWIPIKRI